MSLAKSTPELFVGLLEPAQLLVTLSTSANFLGSGHYGQIFLELLLGSGGQVEL